MTYRSTDNIVNEKDSPDYEKDLATGEEAIKNTKVRKRIDELLEKKRLKELLDDSDDWDV
ncbi:PA3496 family putative envelope integrity protein [Thalassotalea euphylliae]|uniref:PA3496 family putative envelope integrity protein n=1 Tax=Thalassotalea euphylliae TaxID=1655234 RepID=UPI0036392057